MVLHLHRSPFDWNAYPDQVRSWQTNLLSSRRREREHNRQLGRSQDVAFAQLSFTSLYLLDLISAKISLKTNVAIMKIQLLGGNVAPAWLLLAFYDHLFFKPSAPLSCVGFDPLMTNTFFDQLNLISCCKGKTALKKPAHYRGTSFNYT